MVSNTACAFLNRMNKKKTSNVARGIKNDAKATSTTDTSGSAKKQLSWSDAVLLDDADEEDPEEVYGDEKQLGDEDEKSVIGDIRNSDDDEEYAPDEPEIHLPNGNRQEDLLDSDYYRKITVVRPEDRKTTDIMTRFEYSEVLGIRMTQLEGANAVVFTDVTGLSTPYDKAVKEMFDRKCPLCIERHIEPFVKEIWDVNEMGFPDDIRSRF